MLPHWPPLLTAWPVRDPAAAYNRAENDFQIEPRGFLQRFEEVASRVYDRPRGFYEVIFREGCGREGGNSVPISVISTTMVLLCMYREGDLVSFNVALRILVDASKFE